MVQGDSKQDRIRVLLVDCDAVTRAGVSAILAAGSVAEVVGLAVGILDVQEKIRTSLPQVIITNLHYHQGASAVSIAKLVRQSDPEIPVIVLTEDDEDPLAIQAFQAGVSAYILRTNVSTEMLESVIQTVLKTGGAVLNASLMKTVVASITGSENTLLSYSSGGKIKDLTARELEVLRLMATGATNVEIAQALEISQETARKHVSRIIDKLGARNRTHASIISNRASISGLE